MLNTLHEILTKGTGGLKPDRVQAICAALEGMQQPLSNGERSYHNMNHVRDLLEKLEKFEHLAEMPDLIVVAAWFHDSIYSVKPIDGGLSNEKLSAEFAWVTLKVMLAPTFIQRAAHFIEATGTDVEPLTSDGQLFCDLDNSIVGAEPDTYRQYAISIAKEYCSLSSNKDRYIKGRTAFLESWLQKPDLFITPEVKDEYEEQARENMTNEIPAIGSYCYEGRIA